jgi:hypothetical protein
VAWLELVRSTSWRANKVTLTSKRINAGDRADGRPIRYTQATSAQMIWGRAGRQAGRQAGRAAVCVDQCV